MPIDIPTRNELINRNRADIKALLPTSDPYEPTSILNALAVMFANRESEAYDTMERISLDTFSATATGDALIDRAADYGLSLISGTQATGNAIFTGTATTIVSAGSGLQSSNGETYTTDSDVTLSTVSVTLTSLTRSGTTATATVSSGHGLGSGMTITIAGANETDYNGDFVVTVTGETTFTYSVSGSPATPATGTITASYVGGVAPITSANIGQDTNVEGGATLALTSTISGVDNTVYTQYAGIDGGADNETEEELQDRLVFKQANPETPFNAINIELESKKIAGVTRVWVYEPDDTNSSQTATSAVATSGSVLVTLPGNHGLIDGMYITVSGANEAGFNGDFPVLAISNTELIYYVSGLSGAATGTITVQYSNVQYGQTRVLFVRDNDDNIIPTAGEVNDVKDQILTIKPANMSDVDLIVEAPIAKATNFTFTAISPDTTGIRQSISDNLTNMFEANDVGATIPEQQYLTAIQNSYDASTGQGLLTFTLSSPSGDLTSEYNEILTLGTVSF